MPIFDINWKFAGICVYKLKCDNDENMLYWCYLLYTQRTQMGWGFAFQKIYVNLYIWKYGMRKFKHDISMHHMRNKTFFLDNK